MSKKKQIIGDLAKYAAGRATDMILNTGDLLDDEEDKAAYLAEVFGHLAYANGAVTMFWLREDKENLTGQDKRDLKVLGLLMHVAYIFASEHDFDVNHQGAAAGAIKLFERIFNRKFPIGTKKKRAPR